MHESCLTAVIYGSQRLSQIQVQLLEHLDHVLLHCRLGYLVVQALRIELTSRHLRIVTAQDDEFRSVWNPPFADFVFNLLDNLFDFRFVQTHFKNEHSNAIFAFRIFMQLFKVFHCFIWGKPDHQIAHKVQIFKYIRNG